MQAFWQRTTLSQSQKSHTEPVAYTTLKTMLLKLEKEIKLETEPSVLAWDNKLFVGSEDGSIKSFDANLSPVTSWSAHAVQPFAIAAGAGKVYSASNDGGVKVWTAEGRKIKTLPSEVDIEALTVSGNNFLSGDEEGNVAFYEGTTLKATYFMLEEVKGLQYRPPYVYTVRDSYVTVTEIRPEESPTRFVTRHSLEGQAPIKLHGNWLLVTSRGGNSLRLHHANVETEFKMMNEVKVSDMIITSLAVEEDFVWTGGWDGIIRRWKIDDDCLQSAGYISLGGCVNSLVANSNSVYAAMTGGRLLKLKGA